MLQKATTNSDTTIMDAIKEYSYII